VPQGAIEIVTATGRLTADPGMTVTIGRHSESTLQIEDPLVSREHLRIRVVDGAWVVEDAGSRNGSFVDGQRLERLPLASETTIRLGDGERGPWVRVAPAAEVEPALEVAGGTVRIGRNRDNDVVLDDPLVSRHHAELRAAQGGGWVVADLGSFNGTFVNGRRVDESPLKDHDLVGIGGAQFAFVRGALVRVAESTDVALAAVGIAVRSRAGAVLVDDVSFTLDRGALLAVVGPSGAGKSTLLGALTGLRPAPQGSVYFAGRDLYAEYDDLRQRIGFVPQDDVVHAELTVWQSLMYAAELRFAPDVSADERRARVEEAMEELGLTARRDLRVSQLSGGQRKRVSVALELLTKPTLLFLDEPASGLDPGLERSLMELLRRLADGGRTIVVVTHSTESLNLCDRVLFLAPGGRTAFFGPPQLALAYFDRADYQEVFRDLSEGEPAEWKARFEAHDLGRRYVQQPVSGYAAGTRAPASLAPLGEQRWWRQFRMLTRRYARVLLGDPANLVVLAGAAPLLGLLNVWRLPTDELQVLPPTQLRVVSQASLILLVIVLGMTLIGLSNGIREIVRELPVFKRERSVGLTASAYVLSKAAVLAVIIIVQAAIYVSISLSFQGGPRDATVLGWPLGEIIVVGAVTGITAMSLALAASAFVNSTNAAVALMPILLIGQLLLMSGGVLPKSDRPVLRELSYTASAQWGFAAAASTAELNRLQAITNAAQELPVIDLKNPGDAIRALTTGGRGEARWNHESSAWLRAIAALGVITIVNLGVAIALLRRFDPL
jgi:ABC-type multidrug transport system ATPase subunit/pSer/pThr/pTyr-binding forkhead associated (FHA) protein/ABC-type multidrug transport system permease subunit